MRFDKDSFKIRLDLFIRQWLRISDVLQRQGNTIEECEDVMSVVFSITCEILFELRESNIVHAGVHEPYKTFVRLLMLGLNQLHSKISDIRITPMPVVMSITKEQLLIKETVEDLADDIEELFKQPVNA